MIGARAARILVVLLAAAVALGAAGCGNKHETLITADTEGLFVDVGDLAYQVQISRQLNGRDVEDVNYLVGLSKTDQVLRRGQTWFGIFLRVQNETEEAHRSARTFSIVDTENNVFKPIALSRFNVFAYRPARVPPSGVIPQTDSAAANGPVQGALLLFKIDISSLANRPLELRIRSPKPPFTQARIDLDI